MWWLQLMGEKSLIAVVFTFGDCYSCSLAQCRLWWLAGLLGQHITTHRSWADSCELGVVFEYSMVETDIDRLFEEAAAFGAEAHIPDEGIMAELKTYHDLEGGFFAWFQPPG